MVSLKTMKQLLLICAVVALVGCSPTVEIANPVVEAEIRSITGKSTGELTEADLEKVTKLYLHQTQLADVKGLEKCTQLTELWFQFNQLTSVKGLENLTKLESLSLNDNQLTDVKGLEKLMKLRRLYLTDNPDLTKAQIAELQKALPKCDILSNPTK
jgi:Leucine-rich repeat (LRR) protein